MYCTFSSIVITPRHFDKAHPRVRSSFGCLSGYATACNNVWETHAMRTTYDNVFLYRTVVDEIVRARPANSRKKNVTSGELKAC